MTVYCADCGGLIKLVRFTFDGKEFVAHICPNIDCSANKEYISNGRLNIIEVLGD